MATKEQDKKRGGFQRTKPQTMTDKQPRIDELVDIYGAPKKNKFFTLRFLPYYVLPLVQYWIPIKTQSGKEVNIPKLATNFDMENDEFTDKKCPYQALGIKGQKAYYANAIVRDLQEDEPKKKGTPTKEEKKTQFKEKDSSAWTPVRVIRLPNTLNRKIKDLCELNKVKDKKTKEVEYFDVTDEVYGCDVSLKYNPEGSGTDKWEVQLGERTPLTEEELAYLYYNLDGIIHPESAKDAALEIQRMKIVDAEEEDADEDDDDDIDLDEDDDSPKKKKGKKDDKKKSKSKSKHDDDDDEDEDDDDEDEKPSKKKSKSKSKHDDDDDDDEDDDEDDDDYEEDDDDDDDDDDEEDEKPAKKGKGKPAPKKKSKHDDDDDDEDDDIDEDEDEDDDEDEKPAKKGKGKPVAKKKKRNF